MKIPGRRSRDEWIPNYYPSRAIGGRRLRISRSGRMLVLDEDEDRQLDEIFLDEGLFTRLERTGHIITAANASRALQALKRWFSQTYAGPGLFIVAVTRRCNLACTYCHMLPEPADADRDTFDLQLDTADRIVDFILSTPNPSCHIEFQGGEPLLNFPGIQHIVRRARAGGEAAGKQIHFTMVSNLLVSTDEQLRWLSDNRVYVSYTLNGPPQIHDRYRVTRTGKGSFDATLKRIERIKQTFPNLISSSPLCVLSGETPEEVRGMLDFFHRAGFDGVAMIELKRLGRARTHDLGFTIDKFIESYLAGLDYLLEKNRREPGRRYSERIVRELLRKVLYDEDTAFVDWRNPIGDVSLAVVFDYDGEILPLDEARSLRDEFSIGNVRDTTWNRLVARKETFRTMNLSLRDRDEACRECPYNPYCGISPVLEYADTGSAVPRPHESERCRLNVAILDWFFARYLEDPVSLIHMLPNADRVLAKLNDRLATPRAPLSATGAP